MLLYNKLVRKVWELMEDELLTIPLMLENDTQIECYVIAVFDVQGSEYIALLPKEQSEQEILLFRYISLGEDEIELQNIDNDEEWESAVAAFDELMEEKE